MIKRLLLLAVFLISIASGLAITQDYGSTSFTTGFDQIVVRSLKYEPYPAEPGKYFDLWLTVENSGKNDVKAIFTLQPEYPFSLDANEAAERDLGTIGGHQTVLVHYLVRVDSKAVEGSFPIRYEYSVDLKKGGASFDVLVHTKVPILAILESKTEPATIAPGEKSTVTLTLENQGESPLRSIVASLGIYTQVSTTSGISTLELPFTTYGSGSQKYIAELGPHEQKDVVFDIVANPDAASKPYKIPINVQYVDGIGNNYTKQEIVGVIVGAEPKVDVILESTDISKSKKIGSVTLKVVNSGVTDMKFATLELQGSKDYKILSSEKEYIGEIDSDDFQTADFRIEASSSKDFAMPVKMTFSDANNKEYELEEKITLKLLSDEQLNGQKSSRWVWVVVLVIMVAGYFLYRRWEKKKNKK